MAARQKIIEVEIGRIARGLALIERGAQSAEFGFLVLQKPQTRAHNIALRREASGPDLALKEGGGLIIESLRETGLVMTLAPAAECRLQIL